MHFDPADGSKPTQSTVKTGTLATPPQQNPQRQGFRFDGWTLDSQPFDFQTPILQDTTLKAKWTKTTDWTLSPDHGPATGARLTISPPNRQEPQFASIQTAGDRFIGLTGDGRIYTWTQDSTPAQVPFPAQAPDGFHYQQVAAGSRWHAALGSDQHIYTWASGQHEPATLDTNQNTGFTSISLNDYLLLAVDRQGQVHTFQASDADSQNQNPKLMQQAATSLPGQAAVMAVASTSRILIVDSDGQAWTRETSSTKKAEPERIKQKPGMRIVQAQALNQGLLLLDSDGQTYYLADGKNGPTTVSLPGGTQIGKINNGDDQSVIVDKDGHLRAWKPGRKTTRADNGSQQYIQATSNNSRITAIDRQGDMFTWSLDKQDQPGKPARLDTTTAPTLESASMDGQPLKLHKTDGAWRADILARQPGQATILITGSQDGQPFTRSLNYTVDQPLTRDAQQGPTYEVDFDIDGGSSKPDPQSVTYPLGRVQRPSPNPTREGYQFDGWFIGEVAYDFSRPVTDNLTLTAKWTPKDPNDTWRINPDKGSQLGNEATAITPPDGASRGIRFSQVSDGIAYSLAVGSDGNAYAWGANGNGELGDGTTTSRTTPVRVKTPDRKTYPDLPEDFTYVQVSAGYEHSLAVGSDGYAYAWGGNYWGALGNNTRGDSAANSSVPVRVRDPTSPNNASKGLQAIQVSAGAENSLAVGSDGYAYSWGDNGDSQLGRNGGSFLVPGRVRDPTNPSDASKGLQAIQVSAGKAHSLAVGRDGYVYSWGWSGKGELGNNTSGPPSPHTQSSAPGRVRDPTSPNDASKGLKAVQVSDGGQLSLAVGSDGYAYAWGQGGQGQLGNNRYGDSSVPVLVRDPTSPNDASKGLKAVQVSAGEYHSLAVGSDGYAYAWGGNAYDYGLLGNNTTSGQFATPIKVFAGAQSTSTAGPWLNAAQISASEWHSLALGADGYTKAWGNGALGNSDAGSQSPTPVPVSFNLTPVITGVRFDQTAVSGLTRGDSNSVSVFTPAHQPGTVTVSVDYTLGGAAQTPDTSLRYTYLPAGVLPKAGGEGILLALATGMTGMGGVLASRRHRKEQRSLSHASHE